MFDRTRFDRMSTDDRMELPIALRPMVRRGLLLVWLLAAAFCEWLGRGSRSEVIDVIGGMIVCSLIGLTAFVRLLDPDWQPLRFLWPLARTWNRSLDFLSQLGVDFRREPAYPLRYHRGWVTLLGLLLTAMLVPLLAAPIMPTRLRGWLVEWCYLAWLVIWCGLVASIIVCLLLQGFLVWGAVHDWFVTRYRGQGRRPLRPELACLSIILVVSLVAAAWCPTWWACLLLAVMFLVQMSCTAMLTNDLSLVWRDRVSGQIFRIQMQHVEAFQWLVLWVPMLGLLLLTRGETLLMTRPTVTTASALPLLSGLGSWLAWTSVAEAAVIVRYSLRSARLSAGLNPSRELAGRTGSTADPEADRQHEIAARRKITAGLTALLKRAARLKHSGGTGYWVGLQHWYMLGLSYDESPPVYSNRDHTIFDDIIGWPFHHAVPHFARRHYWQMTQALQVDLIYVERGVSIRRFLRVLRMMFEIYDVYGGRQRAEERYFVGLPGVRVLLHEYEANEAPSHRLTGYEEPKYEMIVRARILFVYKDRGEQEVEEDVPQNFEGQPVLSGW